MAALSERGRARRSVVIGAGASGLMTAISLCRAGIPVLLASQSAAYGGGSARLRAGFNAALPGDVPAHAARGVELGAGLASAARMRLLCDGASDLAAWLEHCGVPFDRDAGGALRRTRLYSAPAPWTLTAGARTGHHLVAVLESLARRLEAVDAAKSDGGASGERVLRRLTGWELVDVVVDDHRVVVGVVLRNLRSFEHRSFPADGVCMASGDHAALFAGSTANLTAVGSGVAVAYAAGAALANPEFLQFTALSLPGAEKSIALPDTLLACGARLISAEDDGGERRSETQSPTRVRELASGASVIAPSELARRGADVAERRSLMLDLSDVPDDVLERAVPPQLQALLDARVRAGRRLPLETSVHGALGGLLTDLALDKYGALERGSPRNQATTLSGLYAAGGAACGGSGAEQLPGNELVYRLRSAADAALGIAAYRAALERSAHDLPGSLFDKAAELSETAFGGGVGDGDEDAAGAAQLFQQLRAIMGRACGPKREGGLLARALSDAAALTELAAETRAASAREAATLERLRCVLPLARATLRAAERRTHSVGSHVRSDAVELKEPLRHTFVVAEDGEPTFPHEIQYRCAGQPVTLHSRAEEE